MARFHDVNIYRRSDWDYPESSGFIFSWLNWIFESSVDSINPEEKTPTSPCQAQQAKEQVIFHMHYAHGQAQPGPTNLRDSGRRSSWTISVLIVAKHSSMFLTSHVTSNLSIPRTNPTVVMYVVRPSQERITLNPIPKLSIPRTSRTFVLSVLRLSLGSLKVSLGVSHEG